MKFLSTILLSVLLLSAASCNRKVIAASSHTTLHQDSSNTAIDTSKKTFTENTKTTTAFGDTLKAKIAIPFQIKVDTVFDKKTPVKPFPIFIESNGILIIGSITQRIDGSGFDLDLKAIAKPQSYTSETTKTGTENKGIANNNTNKKDLDQEGKNKASDKEDALAKWAGLTLLGLGILLLIAFTIYLYIKNKNNGKIC